MFLSEPRFQDLPVVLETGSADGGVAAVDKIASRLRERRRRGAAMRSGGEGAAVDGPNG